MWPFKKKTPARRYRPSAAQEQHHRNFAAAQSSRLLSGDTQSASINYWLRSQLQPLRARSREQVRNNPYAAQFSMIMDSNIVGPDGIQIQSQAKFPRTGDLDVNANDAIEAAYKDWCDNYADYGGSLSFQEIQSLAINTVASDGEFILRLRDTGPYGFALETIDPELLDVQRNQTERDGSKTIMGVNYVDGRPFAYYFRDLDDWGQYRDYSGAVKIPATGIIHCYRRLWAGQARGIPWMSSALFSMKMLDGYDEAAITAARVGAAKMGFFTGGTDDYQGADEEAGTGRPIQDAEPGHFEDLGDRDFKAFDPQYPHEQYPHFVKQTLRRLAAGMNVSYNTLAKDLEGVNYSSIRAGVLEDREYYKKLQNWFVRSCVKPVFEEFVARAIMSGRIQQMTGRTIRSYKPANYQGRRWPWVDPLKDMKANTEAITNNLKSRSAIIREQGDDPDTVWREIKRDNERMAALGLMPAEGSE